MPQNSFTSVSLDNSIVQEIFWDTNTRRIEVTHMINLEPENNVEWTSLTQIRSGEDGFNQIFDDYGLDGSTFKAISLFKYRKFDDKSFKFKHAVKFPENGDYYPLSELNHLVVVEMFVDPGGGTTSKTHGQALDV
ncbi:MAG: hypothetical protein R6W71_02715 [Bacteroidales bacterium]